MIDYHNDNISDEGIYKSTSRLLLDHVKMQYAELSETWTTLERKAQGTIAIAGLFGAGIAVIVRINDSLEFQLKFLIMLTFLFLVIACVQAVLVLIVKEVTLVEDSKEVVNNARNIFNADDNEDAKRAIRVFVMDRLRHWEIVIIDLEKANIQKAKNLFLSQCFLVGAFISYFIAIVAGIMYA